MVFWFWGVDFYLISAEAEGDLEDDLPPLEEVANIRQEQEMILKKQS